MNLILAATAAEDAMQLLTDSVAQNDLVVGGIALVALLVVVILKALGKSIPLVDPIVKLCLAIAPAIGKAFKKPAPAADAPKPEGLGKLIGLEKPAEEKAEEKK